MNITLRVTLVLRTPRVTLLLKTIHSESLYSLSTTGSGRDPRIKNLTRLDHHLLKCNHPWWFLALHLSLLLHTSLLALFLIFAQFFPPFFQEKGESTGPPPPLPRWHPLKSQPTKSKYQRANTKVSRQSVNRVIIVGLSKTAVHLVWWAQKSSI